MSLFVVIRENPYFKNIEDSGMTFVEDTEEGMVQAVKMIEDGGKWIPVYRYGLEYPWQTVRWCLLRIQANGFDLKGLKGER